MSYKKETLERVAWNFPLQFVSTTYRKEVERCIIVWGIKNDSLYDKKASENKQFCTNYISTHQYTIATFVPKNIWQQFHRLSNVYFFFLAILQTIRQISATHGIPTIMVPLSFVFIVNGLKDAFEDYNRYKADIIENSQIVLRITHPQSTVSFMLKNSYRRNSMEKKNISPTMTDMDSNRDSQNSFLISLIEGSPEKKETYETEQLLQRQRTNKHTITKFVNQGLLEEAVWEDVKVGDILYLQDGDKIPADMVLLGCPNEGGVVYVETASLDGETNLKIKQCVSESLTFISNLTENALKRCQNLRGFVKCTSLDASLDSINGFIYLHNNGIKKEKINITSKQFILRGCCLRNTQWVIGIVVFTGFDTKAMQSFSETNPKTSLLDDYTNYITMIVFLVQIFICLFLAIGTYLFWLKEENYSKDMFLRLKPPIQNILIWFFMWLVFFANMVPISLIVTMGIVKTIQGFFISWDKDMYDGKTDQHAVVRRSNLNDQLGCITHVLTDKTGTLTCNNMKFRRCCIHGIDYGNTVIALKPTKKMIPTCVLSDTLTSSPSLVTIPHVNITDKTLDSILKDSSHIHYQYILHFFLNLAINNTILINSNCHSPPVYSSSSADEEAMVYGAYYFGIKLLARFGHNLIKVEVLNHVIEVKVLAFFEFSNTRKRTSVLCYLKADETLKWTSPRYILFTKGADSVILPRLCPLESAKKVMKDNLFMLKEYASDGLRTMCLAQREVSLDEAKTFSNEYTLLNSSQTKQDFTKVEELETGLIFQGVVGIEDEIQHGVNDVLKALTDAEIKVWMLTGDKLETAINIGLSTGLIQKNTVTFLYQADSIQNDLKQDVSDGAPLQSLDDSVNCQTKESVTSKRQFVSSFEQFQRELYNKFFADQNNYNILVQKLKDDCIREDLTQTSFVSDFHPSLSRKSIHPSHVTEPFGSFNGIDDIKDKSLSSLTTALVVDGTCLEEFLKPIMQESFLNLCCRCSAVICSRASPNQKKQIVELIKRNKENITLAIGDGANDCSMIQAAHVGVAIRGTEGLQAFNVSDYAISQFRFLKSLVLCHGRWCHRRISILILYMFYKNLVLVTPVFFFSIFTGFTGTKLYYDYIYQLYNILFTSIPVMIFGVFDQDVSKSETLRNVECYKFGCQRYYLNNKTFLRWFFVGILQGGILFAFSMLLFSNNYAIKLTQPISMYFIGHCIYITVLITVNLKLIMETCMMTWIVVAAAFFSIFSWFMVMIAFSSSPSIFPQILSLLFTMLQSPLFYINLLVAPILSFSPDFLYKHIQMRKKKNALQS
ncbi:phospholipid-transporting ATPase IB-like isoform X2 [Hylaeus volcanicus]|uniref:phospholipid-transporting ATPase IB-like isoform X2 n=1 Tax=Hylaeus volcanicus TaxID=313075 RepID=UPI0023B7961C|nr:phospholipid-transporting ATPase IB-like isoform X2 [Hylaeus volcanicus]